MYLQGFLAVLPVFGSVTGLTISAELPAMDIGVAVGTFNPDMGKIQIGVALTAGKGFMDADKRESSAAMIEGGFFLHFLPRFGGMAVIAIKADIAMRAFKRGDAHSREQ